MSKRRRVLRVLIVEARFHENIADQLVEGASRVLADAGAQFDRLSVPGTFEIPAALRLALQAGKVNPRRRGYDGFVALGCVIRGETDHYDHICREVSRALMALALDFGIALGFGVLTCATWEQAWERAAVDRLNRGAAAAAACLKMMELKRELRLSGR